MLLLWTLLATLTLLRSGLLSVARLALLLRTTIALPFLAWTCFAVALLRTGCAITLWAWRAVALRTWSAIAFAAWLLLC